MMARLHAGGLLAFTAATGLGRLLRGRRERGLAAAVAADEALVQMLFDLASEAHCGVTSATKPLPTDWADRTAPPARAWWKVDR